MTDRRGQEELGVGGLGRRDPLLDQCFCLRPITFLEVQRSRCRVGEAQSVPMVRRIDEPHRLGLTLGRLRESAEASEALDQPGPVVDLGRCGTSIGLFAPIGWKHRKIVDRELNHPLVVAAEVVCLLEVCRGQDAQVQVVEPPGHFQRPVAARKRRVQLGKVCVRVRHVDVDAPPPSIVFQPLGEGPGFAQALQRLSGITELDQRGSQQKANLVALLQSERTIR